MEPGDAGVRCMMMRGGTSKGAYFLAEDLPADPAARDDLLLRIMGSPDPRQIDGIGGAHPLTSKVAVVSDSARAHADVDYLFLQVGVGEATVSDRQNCGNLLAGVGPFAVERGLVRGSPVRIYMVNSGSLATATFPGVDGVVGYGGDTAIAGPPLHEVAHLGHIELLTPKLCESLWFFVDVLGLTETGREGNSVYLRTWDDYEHHTLKLTAHDTSGIRRVGLRASSQAALEARVAAIEATGLGISWKDGDPGVGPTYLFRDPDGHEMELYWETEWYTPPDELRPALKNQAQAYPARGVCVRRLDHVNYLAQDVPPNGEFVRDVLGGRVTEQIMLDDGTISAQWLHFTNKGYDLVYTRDWTGTAGRLHHVAFAPDTREDILRAADICLDRGVFIETGPHKHAIQQTFFLYVYEPGGNRIELCNPVARLVLAPDWRTITWTEAERAKGQAWGLKTIESFHTHGTPPVS